MPLTLMFLAHAHAAYANTACPAEQLCTCLQAQEQVKQLEMRRALDAEGWLSDVTILRKQLAAVDRKLHQMRLMDRLQVSWLHSLVLTCSAHIVVLYMRQFFIFAVSCFAHSAHVGIMHTEQHQH